MIGSITYVSEIMFELKAGNIGAHEQLVVFAFKEFNIGNPFVKYLRCGPFIFAQG